MEDILVYSFKYENEYKFREKERSVRKYNMLAYKKLGFEYYPSIREGNFPGKLVSSNPEEHTKTYELELPTDSLFAKAYGIVTLHYTVYENSKEVLFTNITPDSILEKGHKSEFEMYKRVMISKTNAEKDKFKVNLLNALKNPSATTEDKKTRSNYKTNTTEDSVKSNPIDIEEIKSRIIKVRNKLDEIIDELDTL